MKSNEKIRHTMELQKTQQELESKQIFIEEEIKKIKNERHSHQQNCSHISFNYFGCIPPCEEDVRCLLCNKSLTCFPYMKLPQVKVDMPKYKLDFVNDEDINNEEFFEMLFSYSQNKFLELSDKYPEKSDLEIVGEVNEILDEILKNGNREEIMQRLNEYLQAEEKPLRLKKVDTTTEQK